MSVEVTASSSKVTATASGSTVQAAVGSTIVSATSSGGIGPQGPAGEPGAPGATGEPGATGAAGTSGVIGVYAPLTNTGTSTSAEIGLSYGTGLGVSEGTLYVFNVPQTSISGLSDTLLLKANASHSHGSITSDGKIGTASGRIVVTTVNGALTTAASISLSQLSQSSATTGQVVAWNGTAWAPAAAGGYTLPNATTSTLGGVIVGTGLAVASGTVSVSYGSSSSTACVGNDARLSDSRTPLAHNQAWSTITSTPTTLSGYGITDAVSSSDSRLTDARTPTAHNQAWSTITSTPTTLAGYGITDAVSSSDARLTDARTPTAHNQAWSTITSTPTTLSGYGITDAVGSSDSRLTDSRTPTAHNQAWSTITSTPTTLSGYGITDAAAASHTHAVSALTQSGATAGQVIAWSGSAWAPATVSAGGGATTSASDLVSGTLADARLSSNARQAVEQFVHPFLLMGG